MTGIMEQAELLKAMAHPVRLKLLGRLKAGVLCVSDMEGILGVSQPNVSQHLSLMRRSGLVDYYTDGRQRCYFLRDPRVPELLDAVARKKKKGMDPPSCCAAKKVGRKRASL